MEAEIQALLILREINCAFLTIVLHKMNSVAAKSWLFTTQLGQNSISYLQPQKYSLLDPTSKQN